MRSNLIAALGVGMLLLVVFGVTLISQYAGGPAKDEAKADEQATASGVPLYFVKTSMAYKPGSDDLEEKYFQGFYEVSDQLLKVNFWFTNPHPQPVTFTVRGRSCTSCTSANVAVVPPEALKAFKEQTAVARLTVGVVPVPDLVTPTAHLALLNSLKWQPMEFPDRGDAPVSTVSIPPASPDGTPTWGVFQAVIKISGVGPKRLAAEAGMTLPNAATVWQVFQVDTVGAEILDVTPKKIELGDFPEGAGPRSGELYCWSSTRDQADLPPPTVNANVKDPFLRLGTPVPLTDAEKARIVAEKPVPPTRVRGGYRIPVTILRRVPPGEASPGSPTQPDVGPYERQIGIAGGGVAVLSVPVTATMSGVVGLLDGGVIDLKDFNSRAGVEKTVTIVTDRPDLQLELSSEESAPRFMKLALSEPRTEGGRRLWSIKLTVPPDACEQDLPAGSAVVLRGTSGGEAVKVKLPVKGRGFVRGR